MARDYNFWVYIMTNKHRTVLYTGMTDDLMRRVGEHRAGEIPGFTASYRCKDLLRALHGRARRHHPREAAKEMVTQ